MCSINFVFLLVINFQKMGRKFKGKKMKIKPIMAGPLEPPLFPQMVFFGQFSDIVKITIAIDSGVASLDLAFSRAKKRGEEVFMMVC